MTHDPRPAVDAAPADPEDHLPPADMSAASATDPASPATDAPPPATDAPPPADPATPAERAEPSDTLVAAAEGAPIERDAGEPATVERDDRAAAADAEAPPADARLAAAAPPPTIDPRDLVVVMRDVYRAFDRRRVVDEIDLTVPRGSILGIIGPSGAGKTTTIRMLTGAIRPSGGEIAVMGVDPRRFRRRDRERIGYMPQQFTLYEDLTAGENIDFVASLFGMLWRRRRKRVREVLHVVDLWEARGRRAGKLSGGMQRRLELACALVHEPELIILDEPTAGIDPLLRGSIWDELHRLRDAGRTLLVTTQHISEAEECDAVAMIVGGRIIALAAPDELRRMATNGDLLDIETGSPFEGAGLKQTPGVVDVVQVGPRKLRVAVDDAGTALPVVVDAIRSSGTEVESARELRLSFDEIFAILVERHEAQTGAARSDGDLGGTGSAEPGDPRGSAAA
jgi:ABC-2 type transport system ATP-binding protein